MGHWFAVLGHSLQSLTSFFFLWVCVCVCKRGGKGREGGFTSILVVSGLSLVKGFLIWAVLEECPPLWAIPPGLSQWWHSLGTTHFLINWLKPVLTGTASDKCESSEKSFISPRCSGRGGTAGELNEFTDVCAWEGEEAEYVCVREESRAQQSGRMWVTTTAAAAVWGPANFIPAIFVSLFIWIYLFFCLFVCAALFSVAASIFLLLSVCMFVCVFVGMSSEGIALVALAVFLSSRREEAGETDTVQEIGQHASLCCCPWAGE